MISAKLIKDLEKQGFGLEFPAYSSNEERILDILKEENERLDLAIPLLLQYDFDYSKIKKKLSSKLIKKFTKIIMISDKVFKLKDIKNDYLKKLIKENKIKETITKTEFQYFFDSFEASIKNLESRDDDFLKEQINIRGKLNTNRALSEIYSPGKLRIMDKIFNHELLSNTELKYYYRAIRPLTLSILNENLQKYIRIIESTKKYIEKR